MPTGPQCSTMKSSIIKDLLKGLEIASIAAKLAAGLIEERKPRKKAKPGKTAEKSKVKEPVGKPKPTIK